MAAEDRATGHREPAKVRRPLSRARIVRAAVRIMDREGLEAVTMRRVGRALGVEAMSLYNHVRDKEDLLEGILEAVLGEFELPPEGRADWTGRMRDMAQALRRLLHRHPSAVPLFAEQRGPLLSVEALRPIEAALDTLRGAGLSEEDTVHAYRALVGYVFGYVLLETGGLFADKANAPDWPDPATLAEALPVALLPRFFEVLPAFLDCDPEAEFQYGLDMLLAGLETRLRRPSRPPGASPR